MDPGAALVEHARHLGVSTIAVVGTGKNVGKTVTVRAICDALAISGTSFGVTSSGRDGEAADVIDGRPKPRLHLPAGTMIATARALLPRSPVAEVIALTSERSALGPIVVACVREAGSFEIAGPSTAASLRRIIKMLVDLTGFVVIDGAVDRIAALRDGGDAVVVAVGAGSASTQAQAVDAVRALVARLRLRTVDPSVPVLHIDGVLNAATAALLIAQGERRQIVIGDPTRVAIRGHAFLTVAQALDLRCKHSLRPIACTIAPVSPERSFESRAFLRAVAEATALPAFDIYAGTSAEPGAFTAP